MDAGNLHQREHWLSLAPGLHIEDRSLFENIVYLDLSPGLAAQFKDDGYLHGSADWGLDVGLMADTVRSLSAANVSPLFAFLYDEFWYPFFKLHLLYGALLGGPNGVRIAYPLRRRCAIFSCAGCGHVPLNRDNHHRQVKIAADRAK
jgi:hypothetical protein